MMIRDVDVYHPARGEHGVDLRQEFCGNLNVLQNLTGSDYLEFSGIFSFQEITISSVSDLCPMRGLNHARIQIDAVIFDPELFVGLR